MYIFIKIARNLYILNTLILFVIVRYLNAKIVYLYTFVYLYIN